ncbi:MAG: DegV family protein [Anaerolineales bacterium]
MKIVTDCAADLTAEEREALGIVEAPLFIQFPEGEVNSADLTPDEFYDRLAAMYPQIPSTAQPSSGIFAALYQKLAEAGQVLSIHVSSGLSGTINSARMGAEQIKDKVVHVIDSFTLSGGQRFQVLAAALAARAGWTKEAILTRLEQIRQKTEVVYTLETLEYLARGGRIGRVQALLGSVLKVKPVIHVDKVDGKYSTLGKSRTIPGALETIGEHLHQLYAENALWVSVMHGRYEDGARKLAETLQGRLNIGKLEILRISPVLGVHTGPGIVGAAVVPLELMEDLV